jgi:hypothetical protein
MEYQNMPSRFLPYTLTFNKRSPSFSADTFVFQFATQKYKKYTEL